MAVIIGTPGPDNLSGTQANDIIEGRGGNDTLMGWNGNDVLRGDAGGDTLDGWNGNDTLFGGSGNDSLRGGSGNNVLHGDEGDDYLIGGFSPTYADTLTGGPGNDTFNGGRFSNEQTVVDFADNGSNGAVVDLAGNKGQGVWRDAFGGSDTVIRINNYYPVKAYRGTSADDTLKGDGGGGTDPRFSADFYGEGGNDALTGSGLGELLDGGAGDDTLKGLGGNDTLNGGDGDDTLDGGADADYIEGNDGDDQISPGPRGNTSGSDSLFGGAGADFFSISPTALPELTADDGGGFWSTYAGEIVGTTGKVGAIGAFSGLTTFFTKQAATTLLSSVGAGVGLGLIGGALGSLVGAGLQELFKESEPVDEPKNPTNDLAIIFDFDPREDVLFLPLPSDTVDPTTGITVAATWVAGATLPNGELFTGIRAEFSYKVDGTDKAYAQAYLSQDLTNDLGASLSNAEEVLNNLFATSLIVTDDGGVFGASDTNFTNPNLYFDNEVPDTVSTIQALGLDAANGATTVVIGALSPMIIANPSAVSSVPVLSGTNQGDILTPNGDFVAPEDLVKEGQITTISFKIFGWGGDDILFGGGGVDNIEAGDGNDIIYAYGSSGAEADENFKGGGGDDTIFVGFTTMGANVDGGPGSDVLDFTYMSPPRLGGSDTLEGATVNLAIGSGTNPSYRALVSPTNSEYVISNIENVAGSPFRDALTGDSGANTFFYSAGDDTIDGRGGTDTFSFALVAPIDDVSDVVNAVIEENPVTGLVEVTSTVKVDVITPNGDGTFNSNIVDQTSTDALTSIEIIEGSESADTISAVGSLSGLTIEGFDGDDILVGGTGDDILRGGDGDDTLAGGDGDDTLTGDAGSDVFVLAAGEGMDTVTDFEQGVDLMGLADGLTFGELSFSGSNILDGGEILATLTGVNTTTLTQSDFVTVSVPVNDAPVTDGGGGTSGADHIYGSSKADTLAGGSGDDLLDGNGGDDLVRGGSGGDTLRGEGGDDTLVAGSGDDLADGGAGDDLMLGGGGDDDLMGGEGDDAVDGGTGDDTLAGGDGDDSLDGGQGADAVTGGGGDDVLRGGLGDDTLAGDGVGFAFVEESAWYDSILGYVDRESGAATVVLDSTAKEEAAGFMTPLAAPDGALWFLVPNGHRLNPDAHAGGGYRLVGDANTGYAIADAEGEALLATVRGKPAAAAFFSDAGYNADGADHVNRDADGVMAWEDWWNLGDADYNDVVVRLTGLGAGDDIFVLAPGEGTDTIVDFQIGEDLIGLAGGLTRAELSFDGSDINFGDETLATLTGVDTTKLTQYDFLLLS